MLSNEKPHVTSCQQVHTYILTTKEYLSYNSINIEHVIISGVLRFKINISVGTCAKSNWGIRKKKER